MSGERETIEDIVNDVQLYASINAKLTKEESACIVRLMDRQNAALRAELAEAKVEVERMTKDLEWTSGLHKIACEVGEKLELQNNELRRQLAAMTERLAAAEKIISGCGLLRIGNVDIVDAQCDGKYEVENAETGDVLGEENEDGEVEAQLFDDWYAAYQAAIAQGWLPQDEKGGGPAADHKETP